MSASNQAKAGAAAAVIAIAAGIAMALIHPQPDPKHKHSSANLRPDGGGPGANARCFLVSVRADSNALALLDIDPGDSGQPQYLRVRVCADPSDSGAPTLPAGMDVIEDTETADWPYDGGSDIEAWAVGADTDPSPCACAPRGGAGKVVAEDGGIASATPALTYGPGRWLPDSGMIPKTCVELLGSDSMPEACK